ncbi:MAG TPA: NADH-quinone oxidoreductase subunit G, partial [Acidobacteriaceae bacterium]
IPYFWSPGWNSIQSLHTYQEEIAGPLRGGNPGVRLISDGASAAAFFTSVPPPFEGRDSEWLLVPLFHIFGTEELSHSAPAVAQLIPDPYVALNPDDAAKFGSEAAVMGHRLPVRVTPGLPKGVAGLPTGLLPFEGLELPIWSEITRV